MDERTFLSTGRCSFRPIPLGFYPRRIVLNRVFLNEAMNHRPFIRSIAFRFLPKFIHQRIFLNRFVHRNVIQASPMSQHQWPQQQRILIFHPRQVPLIIMWPLFQHRRIIHRIHQLVLMMVSVVHRTSPIHRWRQEMEVRTFYLIIRTDINLIRWWKKALCIKIIVHLLSRLYSIVSMILPRWSMQRIRRDVFDSILNLRKNINKGLFYLYRPPILPDD